MEQTNNITRSALYKEIYEIVEQIPMKQVETDAMDAPSASYLIEQLFKKWQQHGVMQGLLKQSDVSAAAKKHCTGTSGLYGQEELVQDSFEAGVWWACTQLSSSPAVGNSEAGQSVRGGIISCPSCGQGWDLTKHNACSCGAQLRGELLRGSL